MGPVLREGMSLPDAPPGTEHSAMEARLLLLEAEVSRLREELQKRNDSAPQSAESPTTKSNGPISDASHAIGGEAADVSHQRHIDERDGGLAGIAPETLGVERGKEADSEAADTLSWAIAPVWEVVVDRTFLTVRHGGLSGSSMPRHRSAPARLESHFMACSESDAEADGICPTLDKDPELATYGAEEKTKKRVHFEACGSHRSVHDEDLGLRGDAAEQKVTDDQEVDVDPELQARLADYVAAWEDVGPLEDLEDAAEVEEAREDEHRQEVEVEKAGDADQAQELGKDGELQEEDDDEDEKEEDAAEEAEEAEEAENADSSQGGTSKRARARRRRKERLAAAYEARRLKMQTKQHSSTAEAKHGTNAGALSEPERPEAPTLGPEAPRPGVSAFGSWASFAGDTASHSPSYSPPEAPAKVEASPEVTSPTPATASSKSSKRRQRNQRAAAAAAKPATSELSAPLAPSTPSASSASSAPSAPSATAGKSATGPTSPRQQNQVPLRDMKIPQVDVVSQAMCLPAAAKARVAAKAPSTEPLAMTAPASKPSNFSSAAAAMLKEREVPMRRLQGMRCPMQPVQLAPNTLLARLGRKQDASSRSPGKQNPSPKSAESSEQKMEIHTTAPAAVASVPAKAAFSVSTGLSGGHSALSLGKADVLTSPPERAAASDVREPSSVSCGSAQLKGSRENDLTSPVSREPSSGSWGSSQLRAVTASQGEVDAVMPATPKVAARSRSGKRPSCFEMWQQAREAAVQTAEGTLQRSPADFLSSASGKKEERSEGQSSGSISLRTGDSISAPSRARSAERVMLSCSAAFACTDAVLAAEPGLLATRKNMKSMDLSGKKQCTIPAAPRSIPIRSSVRSTRKAKERGLRRKVMGSSSPSKNTSSEGESQRRSPPASPFMVPPPPPPGDGSGPVVIVGVVTDWQGRPIRR